MSVQAFLPALLRPNATFQRRVLRCLSDPDAIHSTLRNLTARVHRHRLKGLVDSRYQWYNTLRAVGEGTASIGDQAHHYSRCEDRTIRSLSGNVQRALNRLIARGLVQRDDFLISLAGTGWPASWYESCYDLTPLGIDLVNTLRRMERYGQVTPHSLSQGEGCHLAISASE